LITREKRTYDNMLGYSLSLLNVNGHAEKTTWGDVVREFLTFAELCGLLGGKHQLQLA
jgi:hypothetical protein